VLHNWLPFLIYGGFALAIPPQRFTISFYLTAMLFIVFDIEIVFLYPLAVVLHQLAWFGFAELAFFVAILVVAYVYVWRKGALEWQ
jgi:NADH-quinone oxidoreductase subunit A